MKYIKFLIIIGLFAATTNLSAQNEDPVLDLVQSKQIPGSTNSGVIYQNSVIINQAGDRNKNETNVKNGTVPSLIQSTQTGNNNMFLLHANTNNTVLVTSQNGNDNTMNLKLDNESNSEMIFVQNGNDNLMKTEFSLSSNAEVELIQQGNGHSMDIEKSSLIVPMKITQSGPSTSLIIRE